MKKLTNQLSSYLLLCTSLSLFFFLLLFLIIIIIPSLFFHLHSSPSSSHFHHWQLLQHHPSSTHHRVLLAMEEKARLGSTPPSCYNKCNGCHPCLAVQVPSLPISLRSKRPPGSRRHHSPVAPTEFLNPSLESGRYSNYKPLGWKCRCRNHLFNP
ncbi:EPIDERMAL PATTERNING FACTOR-like protein 1 [Punica granatum]|uniref:Epidermal patterning factor-like protein n=2 Tax=Punica granatum TaxID=22663 RepID=A0A218W0J7_PUNGR|nr:EPIDERMAL PATTERNING FACTOR-like protein 1 [Punica granatum]OWM65642.1 hypothetical protein CDL15_Pgr017139 [Punica granatum]PKI66210.1 hypothetical protein CRG98_013378 [Punica granatum]